MLAERCLWHDSAMLNPHAVTYLSVLVTIPHFIRTRLQEGREVDMHPFRMGRLKPLRSLGSVSVMLITLLVALSLAACGRLSASQPGSPIAQLDSSASIQVNESQNVAMSLSPASGYGGLYVQVSGEGWPQNMLVLVTLEDAQGRSETLAASDTDQAGNLNTGFLFPIDQRWLASDSLWIVTTTADGRVESKASFAIVDPGTEIVASSTSTSAVTSTSTSTSASTEESNASSDATSEIVTDTVAILNEETAHTVVLPLIASTGPEARESSRTARNRSSREKSSGATYVDIKIDPGSSKSIDCNNRHGWITVAIFSNGDFDATRIDPASVNVADAASDLGYRGDGDGDDSALVLAAFNASNKQGPAARSRHAYQWRWHLEDVDGDGNSDMVMEFRLDYTDLECTAAVVAVTGRTKDGNRFEGTNRIQMLALERG